MGKKKLKQPEKKTFSEYHQLEDLKGYVGTVDIKHKHPVTEMHPTLAPLCSESAESIWTTMFDSSGVTPTSIEHSPDVPSLSPLFSYLTKLKMMGLGDRLFHNGAGKRFMLLLLQLIETQQTFIKISTTNDSPSDWCGFRSIKVEGKAAREDFVKIVSGVVDIMMEDLDGGILSIGEMKSDGASGSAQLIIAVMRAWTTCPKKKCPTAFKANSQLLTVYTNDTQSRWSPSFSAREYMVKNLHSVLCFLTDLMECTTQDLSITQELGDLTLDEDDLAEVDQQKRAERAEEDDAATISQLLKDNNQLLTKGIQEMTQEMTKGIQEMTKEITKGIQELKEEIKVEIKVLASKQ